MIDMVTDHLNEPDVWLGRDLQRADDWIIRLGDSDIAEIDAALAVAKLRGLDVNYNNIFHRFCSLHQTVCEPFL